VYTTEGNRAMRKIAGGRYEISEEVLGEGSFGKVHLGQTSSPVGSVSTQPDGEKVAIKVINRNRLSKYMHQRLSEELRIHSKVKHENIVRMHDVVEEGDVMYLIFELLEGGDIFDFIISNGRLEEKDAKRLFKQLCTGLKHCHDQHIIHHDVKLENCMLKKDRNGRETLKLVDFGLACVSPPGQKLQTFSGTAAYCAAEILAGTFFKFFLKQFPVLIVFFFFPLGREYDGRLIDAYSAGVFLYICLTGAYPFSQDLEVQHEEQADMRYLAALPFPDSVSKEARDLVLQLLHPTPEKRTTIEEALVHPFLVQQTTPRNGAEKDSNRCSDDDDVSGDEPQEMQMDETFRFDEEEWNASNEELADVSWEDQLTNDCKSF